MARDAGRGSHSDCLGGNTSFCGLSDGYADTYAFVGEGGRGSAMGPGTQMDRLRPGDAHEPLKHQSLSLSFFKTFLYMLGSVRQVTVSVALCARALTGQPHTVFLQGGDVPTPPCPVILRPSVSPLGDPRG